MFSRFLFTVRTTYKKPVIKFTIYILQIFNYLQNDLYTFMILTNIVNI